MARGGGGSEGTAVCDPYTCIPKRNRKYASECTEVHLSNLGAEELSEHFKDFGNLEVAWLAGNRLSRVENLETNFRIQEIYLNDNRLVSLNGLRTFKFLRVLLASNNQLRNLEKQLAVLLRFQFLKKLDLFGNPVAEEPDYRLRMIYHVPQVEVLDRRAVKGPERLRAGEVVPNLDKVSAAQPERARRKPAWAVHSELERMCFRRAKEVGHERRREEDAALGQALTKGLDYASVPPPLPRAVRENRERWELAKTAPRVGDFGSLSKGHDVFQVCADALQKPQPFTLTLRHHLDSASGKVRGDVFHQTFLAPARELDRTGRQSVQVSHSTKLTPIGG